MQDIPTIKFEMEGLKMSMVSAVMDSMDEIKEYTKYAIEGAMNQLLAGQLEKHIIRVTNHAIQESLNRIVQDAVYDEIYNFFNSDEGKEIIVHAIREGITLGSSQTVKGD